MRTPFLRIIATCAVLAALVLPAAAQETTATITGVVADNSGGVLPGATVVIRQVSTGRTWEFVTTETGAYTASQLPPGLYEITFQLEGFSAQTVRNVRLSVNDRLQINGTLGVGGVAETVEVSASSQLIQPVSAVQNTVGSRQVQELPLNNRNFVQLATLAPGVSSDLSDEVGIGLTNVVSISINGGRRNAVNWLVDGALNVDVGSNITLLSTPTLESIEEFKIITSSYAAEWPRSGGGIVNVVTKSGTSRFSGSAYEFFRNDKLNANSFFRNMSSNPDIANNPPRLRYNNFGYTVGGPGLPSRQRLFWFWSQEWRKITRAPTNLTANTIDPAWLNDPNNVNYVPPDQRDPNAVALLAAWPAPNLGTSQYIATNPNKQDTRQEVARVDFDINSNWRLTGRYTHDQSVTREPGGLFQGFAVPNVAVTDTTVPGQIGVLTVRTNKGRWLNEASYQFSSNKISTENPEGYLGLRSNYNINIPELFPQNNSNRIPTIAISGRSSIGTGQAINIEYYNHTFTDNFTLTRGNHTYKIGGLVTFEQKNENAANATQGSFSFGTTAGGRTAFQNFLTGNRDGLCGTACSYTEAEIDITNNLRWNRMEFYVQDTWRLKPNLTIDYGLRYGYYPSIKDKNDVLTTFDPSFYSAANAPTFANALGSLLVVNTGDRTNGIIIAGVNSPFGRGIFDDMKTNFQPRFGFTYDPFEDGRTVIRGGAGLYFDQPLVGIFEQNAFVNPPFANSVSVQNPSLSNPASGVPAGTRGVPSLIASAADFESPRTLQWNVGMQRQLYSRGMIDIGYVGSRGDNLIRPLDINLPEPADVVAAGGAANRVRPYLGYTTINMRETTARSRYHGLLMSFRHEQGERGSVQLNYTLSRNRTDATNDRDAIDMPQNPRNTEAEYADARTDRRHIFSASFVYLSPFFEDSTNPVLKAVLGGWQLSGIATMNSGAPVPRITASQNGFRRGNRANQVGDPKAGEVDPRSNGLYWWDPAAFAPPADGTYGDSKRAIFRLPGRHQWDFTLSKNFYPWRDIRVQFRADFINAFNQTQWLGVDAACAVSLTTCVVPGDTFGKITSTRNPREIQLGIKLYW